MAFTVESTLIFHIVSVSAATIAVSFRHVAAYILNRKWRRSTPSIFTDIFITLAWLCLTACGVVAIWRCDVQEKAAKSPGFLYIKEMSLNVDQIPPVLKSILGELFAYVTSLWMVKATLLAMMYDIRGYLGKNLTRWLYFTTIFTGTCWAGLLIVGFTYCRPFETNWSIGNDFCTPMTMKVAGAVTALTITNDLFIFAIPIILVRSLRIHSSILIAIVFTVVFFLVGVVLAILRVLAMRNLEYNVDFLGKVEFFSGLQLSLNLIIACIPQYRILLRRKEREASDMGSILEERREILGFLPKDVGNLVIMKTVEVQVATHEAGLRSGSLANLKEMNYAPPAKGTENW